MKNVFADANRSKLYAIIGFFLGISAPVGWTVLRLLLFSDLSLEEEEEALPPPGQRPHA